MMSVQKTVRTFIGVHLGKELRKKMLTAVDGQWEGLMLWTVCPLSNQLGGHPRLHSSVGKTAVRSLALGLLLTLAAFTLPTICKQNRSSPPHHLSSSPLFLFPPLSLSRSKRDENRIFQLGGAVESVCFRLPHCSLPPLRSSCRLVCFLPPPPHSQHSQGGSGKR